MKSLNEWKEISYFVPKSFRVDNKSKRSGMAGLFSASLELTKIGLISLMQNKSFGKVLIKEKK